MSTWITRGRPPTTYARETSGAAASRWVTSSATRRRVMSSADGAGQRERDHRHVVDFHRLDDPAGHAGRDDVQVLVELLGELHQAPLAVLAHVVADGDDRLVLAAHRVDVLDAVDLVEDLLQGRGDQLLDLGGRVAGKADVHVGQGDDDLRVLFARRQAQAPPGRRTAASRMRMIDRFDSRKTFTIQLVKWCSWARGRAGGLSHEGPPAAARRLGQGDLFALARARRAPRPRPPKVPPGADRPPAAGGRFPRPRPVPVGRRCAPPAAE